MNVNFVDTTLRDGAQSLWAMWMRTGVMEQVAPDLDRAGLAAIELPLNPTFFKKRIRDMKEDPWEMLRLMARLMPHTPKACMAGATINSFEPPPRSIVRLFYQRVAATGAFNRAQLMANTMDQRTRDFPWLIPLYRELGIQVVIALAYQISPRHTDAYYAQLTRDVLAFRPDAIYLKDQGGLVTVDRIRTLLPEILANAGGVPVEFHSHCTTGLAPLCYLEAARLGANALHTGVPPLANGAAQPSIFNVAGNLRMMGYAPQVDLERLRPVSERLTSIALREGLPIGAPLAYDHAQVVHQVPGGVISNLKHQLIELRIQDRLDEVLQETVRVQRELGYPIMITPYSQFVVTQAAINVAIGKRYQIVTDEIIRLAQGVYGEDSGFLGMDQDLKDRVLALPRARELAGRDVGELPLSDIRSALGAGGMSDEDLLLHCIMKEGSEIAAMRSAGPYRRFGSELPLRMLLEELGKRKSVCQVSISQGADTFLVRRNPA